MFVTAYLFLSKKFRSTNFKLITMALAIQTFIYFNDVIIEVSESAPVRKWEEYINISNKWQWLFPFNNIYNPKSHWLFKLLQDKYDDNGTLLNLLLNTLIFIDVYLTIKNPFKPQGMRSKWYSFFVVVPMIFIVSLDLALRPPA